MIYRGSVKEKRTNRVAVNATLSNSMNPNAVAKVDSRSPTETIENVAAQERIFEETLRKLIIHQFK